MKNREIKFRVWDVIGKTWYHSSQLVIRPYSGTVTDGSTTPDVIVQQYIGLEDKNSKEIYEGDIVTFKYLIGEGDAESSTGEVFFEKGIFYFDRNLYFASNDCNFDEKSIIVVGNIFENPELI